MSARQGTQPKAVPGRTGSGTAQAAPLVESRRRAHGIVTIALARPEARNGLSQAMLAALQGAIDAAGADAGVRAVVLAASGPVFCAGHDLKEMTAHRADPDGGRAFTAVLMHQCATLMRSIVRCPKPVIAAVEGMATAAGCQLVATCDLAVASTTARFATPGVNIGLFCSTPMVALSRNVPRKRAMEMLLLGETLGPREAADYGLVNRVVPEGQALDEALHLARTLASKPPATLAIGKEAFYRQIEMSLADAYDHAAGVMVENMMNAESKEGIGAFVEKRAPDWEKAAHAASDRHGCSGSGARRGRPARKRP
jgi:enoyl-CoA hydratase/carnithine racemase